MTNFYIDGKKKIFSDVRYNYQSYPKPAGYKYTIKIDIKDKEMVNYLQKRFKFDFKDKNSIGILKQNMDDSMCSVVTHIINYENKINKSKVNNNSGGRVLNNIEEVHIKDDKLIIEGVASKAYDSYEGFREACKKVGKI